MANTYTTNLSLAKPALGDLNWDDEINSNFDILDAAVKSTDLDTRYLKLDCSNDPLTGGLDLGANSLTTTGTITGDNFFASYGTVGAPSYSFTGEEDSGIYHISRDTLGFTVGGSLALKLDSYGAMIVDGVANAPSFTFISDDDTGFYRIGADNLGITLGGNKKVDFAVAGMTVTGNITATGTINANGGTMTGSLKMQDASETGNISTEHTSGGGVRFNFGITADEDLYMEIGAYFALNNIDTKGRNLRLFSNAGTLVQFNATTGEADFDDNDLTTSGTGTFGEVGIGLVAPTGQLHIDQSSSSGAKPVLRLDQGDIDDTFIDYVGTSAVDGTRSISSDTTEEGAKFGAIRCEINGVTKWIRVYDDHS